MTLQIGQIWLRNGVYRKIVDIFNGTISYKHKTDAEGYFWEIITYIPDIHFHCWVKEAELVNGTGTEG